MVNGFALLAALPLVAAYPNVLDKKYVTVPRRAPLFLTNRTNSGLIPSLTFNAQDQFIDVSKASGHDFQAPGKNDQRGQCPGLNAAANHGYLPRNGLSTLAQAVDGLGKLYGIGPDFSGFLSTVAIVLAGDIVSGTWSIGGSFPSTVPGLGTPQGLLGTHNKYEGDASSTFGDAYLNDGSTYVFSWDKFNDLYNSANEKGQYTFDIMAGHNDWSVRWSKANNPYYFSGPFSGLVAPAGHEFTIAFFSNHSAEEPSGYLDKNILKTFLGITGPEGNLKHNQGQERIPENWYRRPLDNIYTAPVSSSDTVVASLMYPGLINVGGNNGKTDTYTGVDIDELTGGVFNTESLLKGHNFYCFAIQAVKIGTIDELSGGVVGSLLNQVTQTLQSALGPIMSSLSCPQMHVYKTTLFNQYPGYKYKPTSS